MASDSTASRFMSQRNVSTSSEQSIQYLEHLYSITLRIHLFCMIVKYIRHIDRHQRDADTKDVVEYRLG